MPQRTATEHRTPRKRAAAPAASERRRHVENDDEAPAWRESTEPSIRFVAMWKRAVARAAGDLLRWAKWFAIVDVGAALSACFAPLFTSPLGLARLGILVILVPAVLRALAIAHADQDDAALMKAITIVIGVAAVYFVVRTFLVVQVCSF
jgi:hypothetical protein